MAAPRVRRLTKKRAYANQKGGVGKTTWAMFVGAAAAHHFGARVLIREMDPQGNASTALEVEPGEYSMADALTPDRKTGEVVAGGLASAIRRTGPKWPKALYIVPADVTLQSVEADGSTGTPRERRLEIASQGALDGFDLVLTDCQPSVGLLTINALTDSDDVEILCKPESWSVQGAHEAHKTIRRVQRFHNPDLRFAGVWVNQFLMAGAVPRKESRARVAELEAAPHFTGKVHEPHVVDNEAIRKAAGAHCPLWEYGAEAEEADNLFRGIAERALND
ncbi:ParA family protein [Streptomyces sp. NRRL WC-3742]|uniref:ParA family protein n=1 Tax=Streptomyces sp. NRRL WC-3742 TaxID=1463934 RepID=UPI00068A9EC4|nr:ParA family protein [Streptomyces sp. NRRL WC-3742]